MGIVIETEDREPYDVAQSRGVPKPVLWMFGIGVAVIFFVGWISVAGSRYAHIWPPQATTQIPLQGGIR